MRSPAHQDIRSFLAHCQRVLDDRSTGRDGGDPVKRGTEALAAARATAAALPHETTTVPAIDSIDRLPTDRHNRDLVERFQTLADRLPWIPTHRADDQGRELALAPFDLGVSQSFQLRSTASGIPGIDEVRICLNRVSGQPKDWVRLNKVFLDDLRRQFLIWRSIPAETMEMYRERTLVSMAKE